MDTDKRKWWEKSPEELAAEMNEAIRANESKDLTEQELIEEDAEYGYRYWED